jgi:O-antigen ligase
MAELRLKELNPITSNGLPLVPATHLHAHDLLLQAWVERGIVGALVVCALILLVLRKARRLLRSSAAGFDPVVVGAVAALLASFAQNVADYTLWYAPIAILFWIVIGLVFASE